MSMYCSNCGVSLIPDAKFCPKCGQKIENPIQQQANQQTPAYQQTDQTPPQNVQPMQTGNIWYQNNYTIRKKVMTLWNKYWLEDAAGNVIGFSKMKMLKFKEDIRLFTDESMSHELFSIKQEQIVDMWGSFAIIDSATNQSLGFIKRGFFSEFGRDAWELQNQNRQVIGRIFEKSLGRALARKYMPGGALVPEQMTVELNGQPIAQINQDFKIIGDIWKMQCLAVPPELDRRVLIACMILMGNIERDRK